MVNVFDGAVQPFTDGVTVITAVTAAVPLLNAWNDAILPVPLAGKPMMGAVFVQLYKVPVTDPVKFIGAVKLPLHKAWSAGCTTSGIGLTAIVNILGVPVQPLKVGVTVIVAVVTAAPLVVATNEGISPVPLAANPIAVLLLLQLYTVPATAPLKLMAVVLLLLHKVWSTGCATLGIGLTVIVKVLDGAVQPFEEGVTVIVAIACDTPLLDAWNDAILPVPLAGKPITGAVFVQV